MGPFGVFLSRCGWTASALLLLLLQPPGAHALLVDTAVVAFEQRVFQSPVDHYNFEPTTPDTFALRYFVNDQFSFQNNGSVSSILFYAGNEAPIEQFMANSGFLVELAHEFHSLVVFAEHRYYGQSMPFGLPDSLQPGRNISYLTVEQAMQDFNLLNVDLRKRYGKNIPVIAFGGSYGANLALWLRLKNPNLWAGAIASSATPLKHLLRDTNDFTRIETDVYANVSAACPDLVRTGWKELLLLQEYDEEEKVAASDEQVQKQLGLCQPPVGRDDREMLHGWISNALETMVQYGYPYPTEFYNPLPGFPFAETCYRMIKSYYYRNGTGLDALRAAVDVYYNYTGKAGPCYDLADIASHSIKYAVRNGRLDRVVERQRSLVNHNDNNNNADTSATSRTRHRLRWMEDDDGTFNIADRAWSYQTCTEVYQPMPTDGVTDFEVPFTPNQTAYYEACRQLWGVEPRPDWEEMTFMGSDIGTGSNLFLSNGQLDPWRAGGIQWQPNTGGHDDDNDITVRTIQNGAHHYDLRPSNELDPPSVQIVRQEQRDAIERWIHDWNRRHP